MKKRYLILENGDTFEGIAFGADVSSVGELVFTTGMCGYIETLTDPSYYGQIVIQTFPMIGNYGMISQDFEGEPALLGYIVREWCAHPSNFRAEGTLDEYLKKKGIPGLCGIDTRALTRILRERGVMNAMITDSPECADLPLIRSYTVKNALANVTCRERSVIHAENPKYRVALIDCGAKRNIARELVKRGCELDVFRSDTPAEEILRSEPDGIMLSNGPGDPAENTYTVEQIGKMLGKLPIFGICLGHQLLALAAGGKTEKLRYGHRGANQPVTELSTGRTYITSQNHGYAVVSDSIGNGVLSFINANDQTCEGIDYPEMNAFSVQFHPEACSGPRDCNFLFDRFIGMMETSKQIGKKN